MCVFLKQYMCSLVMNYAIDFNNYVIELKLYCKIKYYNNIVISLIVFFFSSCCSLELNGRYILCQ